MVFDHDSFVAPFRLDFKTSFTLRTFHHHVSKQFAFERVEISYFDRRNLIARNEKPKPKQQKKTPNIFLQLCQPFKFNSTDTRKTSQLHCLNIINRLPIFLSSVL